jgi:CRISPR-associated endoribonuclease Cas6
VFVRLHIRFNLNRESSIPIDHQHALQAYVYRLLAMSNADYSEFLHDEGYRTDSGAAKTCKLFCFSGLRADKSRRRLQGDRIVYSPGAIDWLLASPRDEFLLHSATGLLSAGNSVDICGAVLEIESVEALPAPEFAGCARFTCITPIIASAARPDGGTNYLRPADPAFSEAVRKNLLWKFRTLHDAEPADDTLKLQFDERYLADPKHRGGTKLVTFKGISMVGALAPFTLTGSAELMHTAWDCGLGSKNGIGMGMIGTA